METQNFSLNNVYSREFRKYTRKVYLYLAMGLCLIALFSWLVVKNTSYGELFYSNIGGDMKMTFYGWATLFLPFILIIMFYKNISRAKGHKAVVIFVLLSICFGISLAPVFLVYTKATIIKACLSAAGLFVLMTIFGFVTGISLDRVGSIAIFGLVCLIIASAVNFFIGSSILETISSVAAILIFTVLIAVDTKDIVRHYEGSGKPIESAISLYLNIINLIELAADNYGEVLEAD